jgi:hypothetical protein
VVQAGARRHAQAMGGGGSRADSGAAEVGAVRRRVRQAHGERERGSALPCGAQHSTSTV